MSFYNKKPIPSVTSKKSHSHRDILYVTQAGHPDNTSESTYFPVRPLQEVKGLIFDSIQFDSSVDLLNRSQLFDPWIEIMQTITRRGSVSQSESRITMPPRVYEELGRRIFGESFLILPQIHQIKSAYLGACFGMSEEALLSILPSTSGIEIIRDNIKKRSFYESYKAHKRFSEVLPVSMAVTPTKKHLVREARIVREMDRKIHLDMLSSLITPQEIKLYFDFETYGPDLKCIIPPRIGRVCVNNPDLVTTPSKKPTIVTPPVKNKKEVKAEGSLETSPKTPSSSKTLSTPKAFSNPIYTPSSGVPIEEFNKVKETMILNRMLSGRGC